MEFKPYRLCNDCYRTFKIRKINENSDLLFCPRCKSNNIAIISISQYLAEIKNKPIIME